VGCRGDLADSRLKLEVGTVFKYFKKAAIKKESTMGHTINNLQQGMFRLDIGKKYLRRRSIKHGNRQFQKAEAFSLEVCMNVLDKHRSGRG